MSIWPTELCRDVDLSHSCVTSPLKESTAKHEGEEAEETVDVEVVRSLVAITTLNRKHLLGKFSILSVLDLPHAHEVIRLGAHDQD